MSKRALILYPEFPRTFWSFDEAVKLQRKKAAFPPLGALTIASMFPADWERKLVDQNVERLRDIDIQDADYVFISASIVQQESVREDIEKAKRYGKKVILGGPITSSHGPENDLVDCAVEKEAETIFPGMLEDLVNGNLQRRYTIGEKYPNLALTPLPAWNLIKLKDYSTALIQYGRGCPFDCDFCQVTQINGRDPRVKPTNNFLKELDALHEAGWRDSVFCGDDNMIGNIPAVRELLPAIKNWQTKKGYPFDFFTQASINLAEYEDLMEGMREAGFRKVFVGIESPNKESLAEVHKRQNMKADLKEAVKRIQMHGIEVMGGFIVGLDKDPKNIFEQQRRFIEEAAIPIAMVGLLNPISGTPLYDRLKLEGRILEGASGDNTDGRLNFVPKMDPGILVEGYRRLMQDLYSPKAFYGRALGYLERASDSAKLGRNSSSLNDKISFLRSMLVQGVLSEGRGEYWKYLYSAATKYPQRFSEAVSLAVMGRHFRKVSRNL